MQSPLFKAFSPCMLGGLLVICMLSISANTQAQTASQYGDAVYYADYLNGQRTASGELYNKFELTCAHMTFPYGTLLRVTRVDNNQSITVRVNDRGPFVDGCPACVVDLSWAAADQIGLTLDGKTRVSLTVVGKSATNPKAAYAGSNTNFGNTPTSYNQGSNYYNNNNNTNNNNYNGGNNYGYNPANTPTSYSQGSTNYGYNNNTNQSSNGRSNNTYGFTPANNNQNNNGTSNNYYGYSSSNNNQNTTGQNRQSAFSRNNVNTSSTVYPSNIPQSYGYSSATTSTGSATNQQARKTPATNSDIKWLPAGQSGYAVQLASYGNLENARRQARSWSDRGVSNLYVKQINQSGAKPLYRIVVGPFPSRSAADAEKNSLYTKYQLRGFVTSLNQ